jgi:hypothetical protein
MDLESFGDGRYVGGEHSCCRTCWHVSIFARRSSGWSGSPILVHVSLSSQEHNSTGNVAVQQRTWQREVQVKV